MNLEINWLQFKGIFFIWFIFTSPHTHLHYSHNSQPVVIRVSFIGWLVFFSSYQQLLPFNVILEKAVSLLKSFVFESHWCNLNYIFEIETSPLYSLLFFPKKNKKIIEEFLWAAFAATNFNSITTFALFLFPLSTISIQIINFYCTKCFIFPSV